MSDHLRAFILGLPKAELHLHIEGTLEPELMFTLAERHGVTLPYASVDELRAAYDFADLQSFLDLYYAGTDVLRTEQDFFDLTAAYLRRAAADGVVHVEPFFDPQAHLPRGVSLDAVVGGITRALEWGELKLGITWRLIMCFLRDRPAEEAMALLEAADGHRDVIVGVGLDSAEVGNPPGKFTEVFAAAAARGYRRMAHAGEEGPASYVTDSLDLLGAERIDHGNRALDDPELIARLRRERIPLTVCPLSNLKLRVITDMDEHPLRRLMDAGVIVTVDSDDPAYFGGYIADNYVAVAEALGLTRADLVTIAENSFAVSFLDEESKAARIAEVRAYALDRVVG